MASESSAADAPPAASPPAPLAGAVAIDPAAALETAQPVVTAEEATQLGSVLRRVSLLVTNVVSDAGLAGDPDEPYYWEAPAGGEKPPVAKIITHNLHWLALQTWGTMEVVGEFFSEIMGLQNSRYQWASDLQDRENAAAEEREAQEERQRRWAEISALNAKEKLRAGGAAAPTAPSSAPVEVEAAAAGGGEGKEGGEGKDAAQEAV
jgi:hypothetical protein